jgi:hypothetical protein
MDHESEFHFHIYWTEKDRVDWESFPSYDEAVLRALEVALPGEIFAIRKVDSECSTSPLHSKSAN